MSLTKTRIRRFSPLQRLFHFLLMLSFLVQSWTGISRMYIETSFGKGLAGVWGGYEAARSIHVAVGILMVCGFLIHLLYLLTRGNWLRSRTVVLGPDSIAPLPRDLADFFRHIGWFLGLREAPQFDRWGYWEKFDYWAVFWGIPVLGMSGLLLAYPISASQILPGWALNIAFWIHRIEALLAMAHIFTIHFFIAHLRPHSFPMDLAMMEGSVDMHATEHEKPLWIERLRASGKLDGALVEPVHLRRRVLFTLAGYLAVLLGVYLLIGALVNSARITW